MYTLNFLAIKFSIYFATLTLNIRFFLFNCKMLIFPNIFVDFLKILSALLNARADPLTALDQDIRPLKMLYCISN